MMKRTQRITWARGEPMS